MLPTDRFVALEQIIAQPFDSGMVLLDPQTLRYVDLDATAADMWNALVSDQTIGQALDDLSRQYDVERARLEDDMARLVARLSDLGLGRCCPAGVDDEDQPAADTEDTSPRIDREPVDLYLDLMEKTLCGMVTGDLDGHLGQRMLGTRMPLNDPGMFTLLGLPRLRNLRALIEAALREGIPGDVMECGVWRGGATIYMRAVLAAHRVTDRNVWVADSFAGLPEVRQDGDAGDKEFWAPLAGQLAVSLTDVQRNFGLFGLLDDRVRFLPGWFNETLHTAPIDQLAVLRLDGDLYESTLTALTHLYPKVSPGGYVSIDDYHFETCRRAVTEYLAENDPEVEIMQVDWTGVWWQKSR